MTLDDRIKSTIFIARVAWMIFNLCVLALILITSPFYWALAMVVIAPLSYYGIMVMSAFLLSLQVSEEEFSEQLRLDAKRQLAADPKSLTDEQMAEAGFAIGTVTAVSDNVLGRLGDVEIREWVEVQLQGSIKRFFFDRAAQRDKKGNVILSDEQDTITVNGLIFKAST